MTRDARLRRIPPKSILALLEELAAQVEREGGAAIPPITIDTGGTRIERCTLLGVSVETEGPRTALLHVGDEPTLCYVAVDAIRSVVVHAAPDDLHRVGFGRLRARRGEAPTLAALRKKAASISETLGAKLGASIECTIEEGFEDSDEMRTDVDDALGALSTALVDIASDEEGAASLRERVQTITVGLGEETTTLRSGVLSVGFAIERGALSTRSADELKLAIETRL